MPGPQAVEPPVTPSTEGLGLFPASGRQMEVQKRHMSQSCRVGTAISYRDTLLLPRRPLHSGTAPACFRDLVCGCFLWRSSTRVDGVSSCVFSARVDSTFPCVLSSCGGHISTCVHSYEQHISTRVECLCG